MSFNIELVKYDLGEVKIPIKDMCDQIDHNYERLIKKSGFEIVHRTRLTEEIFFSNFLQSSLKLLRGDFVIFVNQSMKTSIPGGIPLLFAGIENIAFIGTLEISDGCTGFTRALVLANQILSTDEHKRVHIICAEKYSKYYMNPDISVSPIFSDAISFTTISKNGPYKLLGSKYSNFFQKSQSISVSEDVSGEAKIKMAGAEVLSWAINEIPTVVKELLYENGLNSENIDSWLIHQGSRIVVETICEQIGIDPARNFTARNIGNTVSSSIPIMISQLGENKSGKYFNDGLIVMLGFGVGLSVVATLIEVKS